MLPLRANYAFMEKPLGSMTHESVSQGKAGSIVNAGFRPRFILILILKMTVGGVLKLHKEALQMSRRKSLTLY